MEGTTQKSSMQRPKTNRKQWTSCDFCRDRKKRCDAADRLPGGSSRCTRCEDHNISCTFNFASQKEQLKALKRKQLQEIKRRDSGVNLELLETEKVQFSQSTSLVTEDIPQHNTHSEAWPETSEFPVIQELSSRNEANNVRSSEIAYPEMCPGEIAAFEVFTDPDQQMQDFLFSSSGDTSDCTPTLKEEYSFENVEEFPHTVFENVSQASTTTPGTSLMRTASGLSPDLELQMLCDFAALGYPQLPVVDMDMVFLRYKYSLPTPLPPYLILSLVACGANYSCQKLSPGIDREQASLLFEMAKQEMMFVAARELCVDAVSALFIVGFHWQGDLSAFERMCLLSVSVKKVQQLELHKEHMLRQNRSVREVGVVKYIVWLNYIVDAFSAATPNLGDIDLQKIPYNGDEIQLTYVAEEDMLAMSRDFFTGEYRPGWNLERVTRSWRFNRAFGLLAKIQNVAVTLQRNGLSTQHLLTELKKWEVQFFFELNVALCSWDPDAGVYKELGGMTSAIVSLNFAYWWCRLNIHFDTLRPYLCFNNFRMLPTMDLSSAGNLDEDSIRGCYRCFIAIISVFETLATGGRLFRTSQIVRTQLYFAGRVLQIFYRNGIVAFPEYRVDDQLLQRWERCLEISELVWGFSTREVDLSSMTLEEIS